MVENESRPLAEVAEQLARVTRTLLDVDTVAEALSTVLAATVELVPGADLVSMTLRSPGGHFHTPFETTPVATELDDVQYRTGHGPCVECARESGPAYAYCADLANAPDWPEFGPAAAAHGYRSILSTALVPDAELSGALNIYSRQPAGFTDDSRDRALLLATHASLALATTSAVERFDLERAQLRNALDTRDVIGQAKGILMQRRGLTADEAFDLLRRTSQELNVKLAEVARTLTSRHSELD